MFNFPNIKQFCRVFQRWIDIRISVHRQLHIRLYMYIYERQILHKFRASERGREGGHAREYICVVRLSLTALSSQANFTFCQRTVV